MITSEYNLPLFTDINTLSGNDVLFHESIARKNGFKYIAGVDEVGRGPLAGPVVAAAIILAKDTELEGVKDSKQMSERARARAFPKIYEKALSVSIGVVSNRSIDRINILNASLEAMKKAVMSLDPAPDFILVDGIHKIPIGISQKCIKKGDQLSLSIAAASVFAKVYRDRIMKAYHDMFPEYGLSRNKGYGTAEHREALKLHGPSFIHRLSFGGVCSNDERKT